MNNDIYKGELKRWNDDKGFGFVGSEDRRRDVFIHISALKRMSRRPVVGDVIIYQVHTDNDGKKRAVNARIEGVVEIEPRPLRKNVKKRNTGRWFATVLLVVLSIFIGLIAYNNFNERKVFHEESTGAMSAYRSTEDKKSYSCAGKVHCSEMTSCDEAKFYLRNCPGTKMDGDGDGMPCERQWCSW